MYFEDEDQDIQNYEQQDVDYFDYTDENGVTYKVIPSVNSDVSPLDAEQAYYLILNSNDHQLKNYSKTRTPRDIWQTHEIEALIKIIQENQIIRYMDDPTVRNADLFQNLEQEFSK